MSLKFVSRVVITEIINPGLVALGCLAIAYNSKQLIYRFILQEEDTDTFLGMTGLVSISTAMVLREEFPPHIKIIELNALKQIITSVALRCTGMVYIVNDYQPWMKVYHYFADEEASIWAFEGKDILTPIIQVGIIGMSVYIEDIARKNFPQLQQHLKHEHSTLEVIATSLVGMGVGYVIYEPQPLKYIYNYVINMGDLTDNNAIIDMSPGFTQLELFGLALCLLALDSPQPEFLLNGISVVAIIISVDLTDQFYQVLSKCYNYLTEENSTSIDSGDFMKQEETPLVLSLTQCLLSEYNYTLV